MPGTTFQRVMKELGQEVLRVSQDEGETSDGCAGIEFESVLFSQVVV